VLRSDWYQAESVFGVPLDQDRAAASSPDRFEYVGDCRISEGCVAGWYHAESVFEVPLDQDRAAAGSPDRFGYVGDCYISEGCVAGWYVVIDRSP